MKHPTAPLAVGLSLLTTSAVAWALPPGPTVLCEQYPASPHCAEQEPSCQICHGVPPALNAFGWAIEEQLPAETPRPLDPEDFVAALPAALARVEAEDADEDGYTNLEELEAGTLPGDPANDPSSGEPRCDDPRGNPDFAICQTDRRYTFKKVHLDFCGRSPTYEALEQFASQTPQQQREHVEQTLAGCLDSEFWLGKNGVLWTLAHPKVRPIGALKIGEDEGIIPMYLSFAGMDYYDDYHLFTYAHIDDHDIRDLLLAQYFVERSTEPTRYQTVDELPMERTQPERRVGMATTMWQLRTITDALPRTLASLVYWAYLGFDLARMEGLYPVADALVDYDLKDVTRAECATCHSTLDAIAYPFSRYNGPGPDTGLMYYPERLSERWNDLYPEILDMPEEGTLLGQPVTDLLEWGQVAANSDQFLMSVTRDYWRLLMGTEPDEDDEEFRTLWSGLRDHDDYSVERMLGRLIWTEAYSVP